MVDFTRVTPVYRNSSSVYHCGYSSFTSRYFFQKSVLFGF